MPDWFLFKLVLDSFERSAKAPMFAEEIDFRAEIDNLLPSGFPRLYGQLSCPQPTNEFRRSLAPDPNK